MHDMWAVFKLFPQKQKVNIYRAACALDGGRGRAYIAGLGLSRRSEGATEGDRLLWEESKV